MSKKNRVMIYEHLFKEGVMVAEKNTHLAKHPELDLPNLHVLKTLNVRNKSKETHPQSYSDNKNDSVNLKCDVIIAVPEVSRLREGAVRVEALLLVPHQRGHPVPEGLPPPAPGDRALHPQATDQAWG